MKFINLSTLALSASVFLFSSCSNDEPAVTNSTNSSIFGKIKVVSVIDGEIVPASRGVGEGATLTLAFDDQSSLESTLAIIDGMSYEEQIDLSNQLGVTNLHMLCDQADDEL